MNYGVIDISDEDDDQDFEEEYKEDIMKGLRI